VKKLKSQITFIKKLASNQEDQRSLLNSKKAHKMPKNMTGGSGHKKGKSGLGFRGRKAKEAAFDMLDLLIAREKGGVAGLTKTEHEALSVLQVGRITRRLGNGWMDVYCQDGHERRCHIRGLLRSKKAGSFMEVDSIVVVTLEKPVDDLDASDDEGYIGGTANRKDAGIKGYIVGLFDDVSISKLQKTRINRRIFNLAAGAGEEMEDLFDRSEAVKEINIDDL